MFTKRDRIRRHDAIRDFLAHKLAIKADQFQVIEEASIDTASGALKPDLVAVNQGRVHVVDVIVRHEDVGYLEGHESKIRKYTPLLPPLAEKLNVDPGQVLPIVVGNRGAIPKLTLSCLEDLKITDRKSFVTLALLALRSSIEIYHAFVDYDAPPAYNLTRPIDPG